VALLILALGAGVSLYEGIQHILSPVAIRHPLVNYIVLGCSLLFEGISWTVAFRAFRAAKGARGYVEAARASKDPTVFMVLFEDTAAVIGIVIAFIGITASYTLDLPMLDGFAAVGISLVLAVVAVFLARETKRLLIGEPAHADIVDAVRALTESQAAIERCNGVFTVQLAPDQIIAALSVDCIDGSPRRTSKPLSWRSRDK
jgi:divalent metal cation (Fe/Co/Zn/Cd) transporter